MKNIGMFPHQLPNPFPHGVSPRVWRTGAWLAGIALLIGIVLVLWQTGVLSNLGIGSSTTGATTASTTTTSGGTEATIALRPSTAGVGLVSAAGNLQVASEQAVAVKVAGTVQEIRVNVGDQVKAGDILLVLDSSDAELAVKQALLSVASSQAALDKLLVGATADEITAAQATLKAAQANLSDVMNGASAQDIASAQSSLAAAQANYNDTIAPPTSDEILQLKATMSKDEVAVSAAQTAYDKIAWQNSAGMTSQAADLQSATIEYESAKAAYNLAIAPASQGDVQSALSTIQSAQKTLDDLLAEPSAADLATAQATVATAQQSLQDLLNGEDSATLAAARATLAQAQLDLESAISDLTNTEVRAPSSGTVMAIDVGLGQQTNAGASAVTLADTAKLQLTVNVAETDIARVTAGMPATITLDALPGKSFMGTVLRIAPASDSSSTVVNYLVTIQLSGGDLGEVRAGMTAVAEMQSAGLAGAWLAPSSVVKAVNGQSELAILRNGKQMTVTVTTGQIQGEWVIVQSPELQEGDQVVNTVASHLSTNSTDSGPGGMGGGPPSGAP